MSRVALIRLLLEAIDFYDPAFSVFSNTPLSTQHKDYARVALLALEVNECAPTDVAKFVYTRFEQVPNLPDAFLASFSKLTNLPLATQLVLLMMLAKSRDPRWSKDAFSFLAFLLHPDCIRKLTEAKVPDTIISDLIQFVATCPLAYLRVIHKRRHLKALKAEFPHIFTNPLSDYIDELPKHDYYVPRSLLPPVAPVTPHRLNNTTRFADLVWDAGYGAFDTVDKVKTAMSSFRGRVGEIDMAITLAMLCRTTSTLNTPATPNAKAPVAGKSGSGVLSVVDAGAGNLLSSCMYSPNNNTNPERGGGSNLLRVLPASSFSSSATTWNVTVWATIVQQLNLNPLLILRFLDQPEFFIPDQSGFDFLMDFWTAVSASLPSNRFPVECFLGLWANRHGQLSVLKRLIACPHTKVDFTIMPNVKLLKPIEDLHWVMPPTAKNTVPNSVKLGTAATQSTAQLQHQQLYHPWYSLNVIESLLSLADIEVDVSYDVPNNTSAAASNPAVYVTQPVSPYALLRRDYQSILLSKAVQVCPELLLAGLVALKHAIPDQRDENLHDHAGKDSFDHLLSCGLFLTPGGLYILDELIDALVSVFVNPHPLHTNAGPMLRRLWQDAPRLLAAHMLRLYSMDRSLLARVLDIAQDLKDALTLILEIRSYPFCIDLAALAAKRQFLNLEVWLAGRIKDFGWSFFEPCFAYVKTNTANADNPIGIQHTTSVTKGLRRTAYNPLTYETAAVFFRVLSSTDLNALVAKERTPISVTDLTQEFHRTFAYACQIHPKLKQVLNGNKQTEVNKDQAEKDAETLCQNLLCSSYTEDQFISLLRSQYKNPDPYQAAVYQALITCILDEATFLDSFPDPQRQNMARMYAYIIKEDLASQYHIGRILAVVLEGLDSSEDLRYSFSMHVLQEIRERLTTWPAYCARVSQIQNVIDRNKNLVMALEGVCKDAKDRHREFEHNPFEFGLDPEFLAGLNKPKENSKLTKLGGVEADKTSTAPQEVPQPPTSVINKIGKIVNDITVNNLKTRAGELNAVLDSQYYKYFARYLVIQRVSTEGNQLTRYAEFVSTMQKPALEEQVVEYTYSHINTLLENDKIVQANDRITLKHLGFFLGLMTLAKNTPIRAYKLDLKDALFNGYDRSTLTAVVPFVTKCLEGGLKSTVFKMPNPWVHSIFSVLKEIKQQPNISPAVQFEIDDMFSKFKVDVASLKPCEALVREELRPRLIKFMIPGVNAPAATAASNIPPALAPAIVMINQVADATDLLVHASKVVVPKCKLLTRYPQLSKLVLVGLELAVRDLINSVRDKFIQSIAANARDLIMSETSHTIEAENQLKKRLSDMIASLTQQALNVFTVDNFRKSFMVQVMRVVDTLVDKPTLEEFTLTSTQVNSNLAFSVSQKLLTEQAHLTINEAIRQRNLSRDELLRKPREVMPLNHYQQQIQSLPHPARQALEALSRGIDQVHIAVTQVPNFKNTPMSAITHPEHPVCLHLSQTVPNCIKQCLSVAGIPRDLVFRFVVNQTTERLLDTKAKHSLLHFEVYKTLLWHVIKSLPTLPKELALRFLQPKLCENSECVATVAAYSSYLVKAGLLYASDVDEYIHYLFYQLCTNQSIILANNASGPCADPRMESWMQLVMSMVLPTPSSNPEDAQLPSASLPVMPLSEMPRTAESLKMALQAVQIPAHAQASAPVAFLNLSRKLHVALMRILDEAKEHHIGLQLPPMPVDGAPEVTVGAVGDMILPNGHVIHHGAANTPAIITAELSNPSGVKSALTQTQEKLHQHVDIREKTLSLLDSNLTDTPYPHAAAQLAESVLNDWVHTHYNVKTEAAYASFASSLWKKAIWGGMSQVRSFTLSLVNLAVHLLTTNVANITKPQPLSPSSAPIKADSLLPSQVAEAVTSLVVFMFSHVDAPLSHLTDMGRGDELYTGAGVHHLHQYDSPEHQESPTPKPESVALRVKILREYCFSIAEVIRVAHNNTQQAMSAGSPNPPTFATTAYGYLLTTLMTALAVPDTPMPVGDVLASIPASTRVPLLDLGDLDVVLVFHDTFRLLSPSRVPSFVFVYLECISHRTFMPRLLIPHMRYPILTRYYIHLLLDVLTFLHPYLRAVNINNTPTVTLSDPIRLFYKATLRVFLILFHDFPDVLAESALLLCDRKIVPDTCMQIRNLILAASPRYIVAPTPFAPNLRMEQLSEVNLQPRLILDPTAPLLASPYSKANILEPLEAYVQSLPASTANTGAATANTAASTPNAVVPFPARIIEAMKISNFVRATAAASPTKLTEEQIASKVKSLVNQTACVLDSQVLLAVLMYLAHGAMTKMTQILSSAKAQGQLLTGLQSLFHNNYYADATVRLVEALDVESRHLLLILITNQLRYPSTHTHYFSSLAHYIYFTQFKKNRGDICEQVVRVLFERLIIHRPHPWGLLVTFIEILRNPIFELWKQPFTHCHPQIEELFQSVAKTCISSHVPPNQQQPQQQPQQ